MMSFSPRTISKEELQQLEIAYADLLGYKEKMEPVWEELHAYFKDVGPREDRQYWNTFFRWYTELTWSNITSIDHDVFVDIAIKRQVPMALLLDFDVWKEILRYFIAQTFTKKEREQLFDAMQKAFFSAEAIMGGTVEQPLLMKHAVSEVAKLDEFGADSLQMAEQYSQLTKQFYDANAQFLGSNISPDNEGVVKRFTTLVHFFVGVKPKQVQQVLNLFYQRRPEVIEDMEVGPFLEVIREDQERLGEEGVERLIKAQMFEEAEGALNISTEGTPDTGAPAEENVPINNTAAQSDVKEATTVPAAQEELPQSPSQEPASTEEAVAMPAKPTYKDIQQMVDARFGKDEQGIYLSVEGVLALLDSIATEHGDDAIRDLYYFDEQTGSFHWDETLLAS